MSTVDDLVADAHTTDFEEAVGLRAVNADLTLETAELAVANALLRDEIDRQLTEIHRLRAAKRSEDQIIERMATLYAHKTNRANRARRRS